jgi:gluconokinase
MIVVVMGVSGAGKTVVGSALAARLGWRFLDADDFHPPENIERMRSGIPLTDDDRALWLAHLRDLLERADAANENVVLACSALRRRFREELRAAARDVRIVYLTGSIELIEARLRARQGHFMPPELLPSQYETLEEPEEALVVDVNAEPAQLVERIVAGLALQ